MGPFKIPVGLCPKNFSWFYNRFKSSWLEESSTITGSSPPLEGWRLRWSPPLNPLSLMDVDYSSRLLCSAVCLLFIPDTLNVVLMFWAENIFSSFSPQTFPAAPDVESVCWNPSGGLNWSWPGSLLIWRSPLQCVELLRSERSAKPAPAPFPSRPRVGSVPTSTICLIKNKPQPPPTSTFNAAAATVSHVFILLCF